MLIFLDKCFPTTIWQNKNNKERLAIQAERVMSFLSDSPEYVNTIDALEGTIDLMKEKMRERHTERLQKGECGIEEGFVWCDLITDMERVADHCTNISDSVIELQKQDKPYKDRESYQAQYNKYQNKYLSFT